MIAPADIAAARTAMPLPHLVARYIQLSRQGGLWTACCPFHLDRSPSLIVWPDHYHCYGCGAHGDAIDWVSRTGGLTFREAVRALIGGCVASERTASPALRAPAQRDDARDRLEQASRIWNETMPGEGSPAETYLQHRLQRGGFGVPAVIRFHPSCPRGARRQDRLPAMVALMSDPRTGEPCGIHRTYLQPDGRGKADVDKPKMMLGRAGIVRLVADDEIHGQLALAEGIETALACTHLVDAGSCWAALSAGGIRKFPVLQAVHGLRIMSDPDQVGVQAAHTCRDRWRQAGWLCQVHIPPAGVGDWLDLALAEGW